MADILLTDLTPFAGVSIQDTDVFWIDIDNGDTTFSSQKISGAQMKDLMPNTANVYSINGTIDEARTVTIDDATGNISMQSTKTKLKIEPGKVTLERLDAGAPTLIRSIRMLVSDLSILSNKIIFDNYQLYQVTHATVDAIPDVAQSYTPSVASNFVVSSEVKGYCAGTNDFHYSRITNTYRTVASVPVLLDSEVYVANAGGMSIDLVINGTNIDLQVTGVAAQIVTWKVITKVF